MTPRADSAFSAAILAGGSSRRMGRDKATVCIEGRPLVLCIADVLHSAGASEVFAVGGERDRLAALGVHWVPDLWAGEGPLGAVITALEHSRNETVFVAATDLVGLTPGDLLPLVQDCRIACPVVLPFAPQRPAVLQGAYHRSCATALRAAFEGGERSVVRAIAGLNVTYRSTVRAVPDIDTPEDLDLYIQSLAR